MVYKQMYDQLFNYQVGKTFSLHCILFIGSFLSLNIFSIGDICISKKSKGSDNHHASN